VPGVCIFLKSVGHPLAYSSRELLIQYIFHDFVVAPACWHGLQYLELGDACVSIYNSATTKKVVQVDSCSKHHVNNVIGN
jgi:hypothetical protein